jgi:hypothetical protein
MCWVELIASSFVDNGSGISKLRAEHDFESLGESWKLQVHRTPVLARAIHGKEGKGRLRFFSLANRAQWSSVYRDSDRFILLSIGIDADRLQTSNVSEPEPAPNATETGTVVELAPLKDTFDWLGSKEARAEFNAIFAPYILQYPGTEIAYDGKSVDPSLTIERADEFGARSIVCPSGTVRKVSLKVSNGRRRVAVERFILVERAGLFSARNPQTFQHLALIFPSTLTRHSFRRSLTQIYLNSKG